MNPEILLQLVHDLTERALRAERDRDNLARRVHTLETELAATRPDT